MFLMNSKSLHFLLNHNQIFSLSSTIIFIFPPLLFYLTPYNFGSFFFLPIIFSIQSFNHFYFHLFFDKTLENQWVKIRL